MAKPKVKLLTVKFELQKLAEYYAAAEVARARTISEFVHQQANRAIEAARAKDPDYFAAVVTEKRQAIMERSKQKSKERRKGLPFIKKPAKLPRKQRDQEEDTA